ncbi:C1 family peptidase [Candidatus Bathyarchaeota archaeon]|nr:C1 family peptidase [Candidatus Bathyarchaeota archaeon]
MKMGYWTKRLLNLLTLGLRFKPWSIYFCLECGKWVSRTHTHRRKFKKHRVYAFGWKKDPRDPRDLVWSRLFRTPRSLPERVDLRFKESPILDQGNEGACVGFAGAALKNWYEIAQKDYPAKEQGLSPRCIYNLARALEGRLNEEGAYLRDALKGLQTFGTCTEAYWPYRPWVDSGVDPRWKIPVEKAEPWRIRSYVRLETVDEVLQALASGLPVYAGVPWCSNWMSTDASGKLPRGDMRIVGGHAILFLGYDLKEGRLLLQNSWGKGWGARGCAWMIIDDLKKLHGSSDFWTVVDLEPPSPPGPEPEPPKPDNRKICDILDAVIAEAVRLKGVFKCDEGGGRV